MYEWISSIDVKRRCQNNIKYSLYVIKTFFFYNFVQRKLYPAVGRKKACIMKCCFRENYY